MAFRVRIPAAAMLRGTGVYFFAYGLSCRARVPGYRAVSELFTLPFRLLPLLEETTEGVGATVTQSPESNDAAPVR